jgi:hypothetical protein
MMHMMESLTASMNETFNKTTTSMNEMLHKSQASTEITLEWMQRAIAAMADRVQALETRLPIAATDPNATAVDTHADGDPFAKDLGVDNDEHSELPDPPPRQRRPFNRQAIEHGLELVKKGVVWRIRSGEKVNIWRDMWLLRQPSFRITMKKGQSRLRWVS